MDRFAISVKGVLEVGGRLLFRVNERNEYELLGGHLEPDDRSLEGRLITELLEESGIEVEVGEPREPWLYEVGDRDVLIVPYVCRAVGIPEVLVDQDGGTLHWVRKGDVASLPMPRGYLDTVLGEVPRRSISDPTDPRPETPSEGGDAGYGVEVRVVGDDEKVARLDLVHHQSPREAVRRHLGPLADGVAYFCGPAVANQIEGTVTLRYGVRRW